MMSKKRFIPGIIAILAALACVGGLAWWTREKSTLNSEKLTLYGNVDIRQVDLAFLVSDRILEMHAKEGDKVQKGQLLASLRTDRFASAVRQSRSQVDAQAQVVAKLEAGSRPQEIEEARARYASAQSRAENARVTYERTQSLSKVDAVSKQNADDAQAQMEISKADAEAAKQTLDLALAGPRKEDIDAAKATLEAYQAQLAITQRNLEDTSLFAPASGVIQNRILEPGDLASPQTPVYLLALTDPVWIRTYVSETDLGKIHEGMAAAVTTDSFPNKTYEGWVGYISPTAEFTPKAVETPELRTHLVYQIRIYVNNPQNELRLGMPATVTINLSGSSRNP